MSKANKPIVPGSIEERKLQKEARFAEVFNPAGFVDVKKEQFIKDHKGKVPFDLNEAWNWIQKELKKLK